MEKELNEGEDFWDWNGNREQSLHFEVKSKKDEFNDNSKMEEINNNKGLLTRQSHDHEETDEKKIGSADNRSVRIEKLIKSLDKLKPTHYDRNVISESQKSDTNVVNEGRHFDSLENENHINSVDDNHSQNEKADATAGSDGSDSDRETHGIFSKDKRRNSDLKLDDGKAAGFSHHEGYEDVVSSARSNETDEAKSLNGDETFVDYGLSSEGSQLKRDSHISPEDSFMLNEDSQERTFEVHPPKSGAPCRNGRKMRKPDVVAKSSKTSHHSFKGNINSITAYYNCMNDIVLHFSCFVNCFCNV